MENSDNTGKMIGALLIGAAIGGALEFFLLLIKEAKHVRRSLIKVRILPMP